MKPLQHVTILDLSRVLACPFASMILAELGATVIKIEEPNRGDETRGFEPFVAKNGASESAYYFACNRGKQSVTVNLRSPEGQQITRELARNADVFLENFPVGTLARYGLDYPAIRAVNERIVYVSCTGFGQSGPLAHRKGYDTIFQAMGGIMSLTGERGGAPVKPGLPVGDLTSGLWVAIAILSGLAGRSAQGNGATSTSPCSMARFLCSRSLPRAGSRSARCRRGSAPSIPAACRRRASCAPTAAICTSPPATSTGCRSAGCSGSKPGAAMRSSPATADGCAGATR
jgi:crotonobetainyl-CoA:carnitine CoA-transferase CaiB-like acyl-CoA transferase